MSARRTARLSFVVLCSVAGCDAASTAVSATMWLRVADAQLVPGLPSAVADDGPGVRGLNLLSTRVEPGQRDKPLGGVLDADARATVIYLIGDGAHYILPAGAADLTAPGQPTFAARLSFAAWLPLGPQTLAVHAADEGGSPGAGRDAGLGCGGGPACPRVAPAGATHRAFVDALR